MPGMYSGKDYDVAGIVVGAIPPASPNTSAESKGERTSPAVAAGDVVIALTSTGLQHHDFELLENILMAGNLSLERLNGMNGGSSLGEHGYFKRALTRSEPVIHSNCVRNIKLHWAWSMIKICYECTVFW